VNDLHRDPWQGLASLTSARIALGRSGGSLRTSTQLELRLAHARAKDAIRAPLDSESLTAELVASGVEAELVQTRANDRQAYLMDPEKGRALSPSSRSRIAAACSAWGRRDLVIVVSDGLSALAAERNVVPTLRALLPLVPSLTYYPVFVTPLARVKLADEMGELLGANLSLILLGERPGLSSPDSLGAYMTYAPDRQRTDAERNCISNIRADGVAPAIAARQIAAVLLAAHQSRVTGIGLSLDQVFSQSAATRDR